MEHQLPLFNPVVVQEKLAAAEGGEAPEFTRDEAGGAGAFEETALSLDDIGPSDDNTLSLPGME